MLAPGQTIERYTVEAVVGQGGMAVVYRVRHNQLGSLYALKILTVPKPHIRDRLLVEGRAQAAIRHPNVVAVFDVLEVDGSPALLMEYVDGPTLEEWLENDSPTVEEAQKMFLAICAGVGEAHSHGLVHRDLKPANVLLSPTTGGWVPKVTDFGIAKIIAGDALDGSTRTNVAMGTPHYMAPEQIRDAKTVDQRADVFSLGCILYELVCGEKPFTGPDVLTVLNSVATGRFASPRKHVPDLPDHILKAIEGALRVDRDNRLQGCAELVAVIAGVPAAASSTWPSMRRMSGGSPSATIPDPPPQSAEAPEAPDALHEPPTPILAATVSERGESLGSELGLLDPALVDKNTPSTPIDPNASTVPHVPRREAPRAPDHAGIDRSREQGLRVALAGSVVLLLFAGALWWNLEPASHPTARHEDEPVMGVTREVPTPDLAGRDEAPSAAAEGAVVVLPGKPTARSATGVPIQPIPVRAPGGLGLFEPEKGLAPAEGKGRVEVRGDVRSALLAAGSKEKLPPGDVPPGKYDVQVSYPGREAKVALQVEVSAGQVVRVDCGPSRTCAVVAP